MFDQRALRARGAARASRTIRCRNTRSSPRARASARQSPGGAWVHHHLAALVRSLAGVLPGSSAATRSQATAKKPSFSVSAQKERSTRREIAVAGESEAMETEPSLRQDVAMSRDINTAGRFQARPLVPAALLPVAEMFFIDERHTREPLGMLDSIFAGRDDTEGEAVGVRQGNAVHLVDETHLVVQGKLQGKALGVAVGTFEHHEASGWLWLSLFQQRTQDDPLPQSVADEVASHPVADTLQRVVILGGRSGSNVSQGERERSAYGTVHLQAPGVLCHRLVEQVLGH